MRMKRKKHAARTRWSFAALAVLLLAGVLWFSAALKNMEAQGVEILTCGTCLNFYGLSEQLAVGSVTNMYAIVEKLAGAGKVVKP